MIGISPLPTVISKGLTGPTRAGWDWNVQQSPSSTSSRWARRGGSAWTSAIGCQIVVGTTTTITTLKVAIYGTPLATDSITFTLQKNGVDTALTVTLAAGATSATGAGSISVVPGDYLTCKAVQTATEFQTSFWCYMFASD
jgi:hypothetical protein